MQTVAAISCDAGETNITIPSDITHCRRDIQIACQLQGRVVSKVELNAFPPKNLIRDRICSGCCQLPLPCPTKPPVNWQTCPDTDINKSFELVASKNDCHRCQDGCKTRCDNIGARVVDQICGYRQTPAAFLGLICTCCCRAKTPAITPLPPPPTPASVNICRPAEIYVAFLLSGSRVCSDCSAECEQKCSGMGPVALQQCTEGSSSRECKCCCEDAATTN
ncbi:hypothetical protein C5167_030595 [Papaver somniferum]|nr:hypothetical protein C5167_030595 [Papaver somniferum]